MNRCRRLAAETIRALDLDLSGLAVLTEAATGNFALTASLAALAGASRVLVIAKDSRHGAAKEAVAQTLAIARQWNCADKVETLAGRDSPQVSEADIVTNLGAVRPLDDGLLARLKATAVIPLMFETWEYRREDLDLDACRRRGIAVLGTNERHPGVEVLSYLGPLAVRLVLEAGVEIFRSRIAVLGSGIFAEVAACALRALGAEVDGLPVAEDGSFDAQRAAQVLPKTDALLVAEHRSRKQLLGASSFLDGKQLIELNPGLAIVHISGNVDQADLAAAGVRVHPEVLAPPGYMTVTTAYVGPAPVIRLHAAGLKVGEIMVRLRLQRLSPAQAERKALDHPLCQGFAQNAHV
ncbi:MAG TPA: hypothetical protein VH867_08535 [Burkholderiales bacterium]